MCALNVLFDVLYTLTLAMAPFTPFLAENIYQHLRGFIEPELLPRESRSVHFLSYPEEQNELYDLAIERSFQRMQKVVELARALREKHLIGLKTPLKSLIVLHHDEDYLRDVQSLSGYIVDELNIREIIFTDDEEKYGVQYSAYADWPKLGKRLRQNMPKVKEGLKQVTSEEVKEFVKTGNITVAAIELGREDLQVMRGLDALHLQSYDFSSDKDVFVILDTAIHPELEEEGLIREIINRVQRLRKKAGLLATDSVKILYEVVEDEGFLSAAIEKHQESLRKSLKSSFEPKNKDLSTNDLIFCEEQSLSQGEKKARLVISLLRSDS